MPKFESTRPPEITPGELPNVIRLLNACDKITFNAYGEIVGVILDIFPLIGPVLISLYDRESHINVYRRDTDDVLWSGCLYDVDHDYDANKSLDRDSIISTCRKAVREEVAKLLV